MKKIQLVAISLFAITLIAFVSSLFISGFKVSNETINAHLDSKGMKSEILKDRLLKEVAGMNYSNSFSATGKIRSVYNETKAFHEAKVNELESNKEWEKANDERQNIANGKSTSFAYDLMKPSGVGHVHENKGLWLFLTFGLAIIASLIFILINLKVLGPAGIKNTGIYFEGSTNRGWIAWITFSFLVLFYVGLYFFPSVVINWTYIVDPVKDVFGGGGASQWFLYGLLYCTAMSIMGVRMIVKYRHNKYQIVRTISVVFFQVVFAFLLAEILPMFGLPGVDLKNAWPLDYDFLFDWNVTNLIANGHFGKFVFVWGILLSLVIIPVMVYLYGKRWYCSWVCGCGGLAETLGDPYRQHSDKTVKAWKFERYIIHFVLLFAIFMTIWTGYTSYQQVYHPEMDYNDKVTLLGISSDNIRFWYGFFIGSIFSGVIGTGFYPIFGNRVWCRFGCPLAAYMGLVQRFKSRFRITTNGGQCISCGNCSTYCEQGIDVRAYAQKGQNIIRSSCVGCGVCSAVCPRGVLKLENGPEIKRISSENPIVLGNEAFTLNSNIIDK